MYHRNVLALCAAAAISACSGSLSVPTFSLQALQENGAAVTDALRENGLLAIEMPSDYVATRNFSLHGVCSCWNSLADARSILGNAVNGLLQQGARTTVATATAGSTPLPLPTEVAEICGQDVADSLDALRDQVAVASHAFISTWDRNMSPTRVPLLRTKHGVEYHRIHDIVESSTNLEHFHLYSKTQHHPDENDDDLTVHTDAGLFLSFVPALDCTNGGDSAFWVQDHHGNLEQVDFPENAVIIMMGAGAEHWLQSSDVKVRATRHAVRMHVGTMRAWYGMMHLVPLTAIVQTSPEPRTLADLQQALVHSRSDATLQQRYEHDIVSMGCGHVAVQESSIDMATSSTSLSPSRRRLAMVDDASVCNNATNFYCWMSCLDIPDLEHSQEHLDSGYGLYCVDPSVMDTTNNNVSQSMEPCIDGSGLAGSAMNPKCMGSWQPKVLSIDSVPVNLGISNNNRIVQPDAPYCYGGSTMFHEGFQWHGATCAIYLFPEWVLSSRGKLIAACFGTILLGLLVEFILYQRKKVLKSIMSSSRAVRLTVSALMYGIQLTAGSMVMLIVMIYSTPLFVSVIGGLVFGHVLFNAKDSVFSSVDVSVKATDIESDEDGGTEGDKEGSLPRSSSDDDVEGITPCCQNALKG